MWNMRHCWTSSAAAGLRALPGQNSGSSKNPLRLPPVSSVCAEFVVEYEESQWEPGVWKKLQKVPGNQATAELVLHGDLNYKFRVYAVNAVGPGPPGNPTETHETPPAGETRCF